MNIIVVSKKSPFFCVKCIERMIRPLLVSILLIYGSSKNCEYIYFGLFSGQPLNICNTLSTNNSQKSLTFTCGNNDDSVYMHVFHESMDCRGDYIAIDG